MDTLEKIIEIISNKTHISPSLLDEDSEIYELCKDSIDLIEIYMAIEDKFDIDIPDEKIRKINNLGELERYIENSHL